MAGRVLGLQISDDLTGAEALIHVQHSRLEAKLPPPLQQTLDDLRCVLFRQYLSQRQPDAPLPPPHRQAGAALEMGAPCFGLTTNRITEQFASLPIEWLSVLVQCPLSA